MNPKKGLGKGFGSLLPDNFDNTVLLDKGERVQKILIQDIKPDPNQPRRSFDAAAIDELAQSIKRYGILQPLVITDGSDSTYVIIAGERRFRAAKKAGLTHVPALIRTLEDIERLEIGLIENMQRVDLSPMDQALSIARLHEQFNMDLHDIAERLGKAHTTVVNIVRLLQLPDFARQSLEKGEITEGHARAILALKGSEKEQKQLLDQIKKHGWSVRQAEYYVKQQKSPDKSSKKLTVPTTKDIKSADLIQKKYGGNVTVTGQKSGIKVELKFKTNKEFTQFLKKLNVK